MSHSRSTRGNTLPTTAPVAGVITSVRYRSSTADSATLRLAKVNALQQATGAGTGPTATLEATGSITEVPVNPGLPVDVGDYLAGDGTTGNHLQLHRGAGGSFHLYLPPLVDGDPFRTRTTQNTCEILVQATIEPDADADRLGDESQDTDDDNDGVADAADNCPLVRESVAVQRRWGRPRRRVRPDRRQAGPTGQCPRPSSAGCSSRAWSAAPSRSPIRRESCHRQGARRQKGLTFIPLEQAPRSRWARSSTRRRGTVALTAARDTRGQDPVGQVLARPVPGAPVAQAQRARG